MRETTSGRQRHLFSFCMVNPIIKRVTIIKLGGNKSLNHLFMIGNEIVKNCFSLDKA